MDKEKKYNWHKLAENRESVQFSADGIAAVSVAGKELCLILFKDQLYACSSRCPHAGGMMANGYIDAVGNIVCPTHRYKFSLQNGRNSSGEGYFLKTYPVEQREDGLFIGIEAGGLLSWLK